MVFPFKLPWDIFEAIFFSAFSFNLSIISKESFSSACLSKPHFERKASPLSVNTFARYSLPVSTSRISRPVSSKGPVSTEVEKSNWPGLLTARPISVVAAIASQKYGSLYSSVSKLSSRILKALAS